MGIIQQKGLAFLQLIVFFSTSHYSIIRRTWFIERKPVDVTQGMLKVKPPPKIRFYVLRRGLDLQSYDLGIVLDPKKKENTPDIWILWVFLCPSKSRLNSGNFGISFRQRGAPGPKLAKSPAVFGGGERWPLRWKSTLRSLKSGWIQRVWFVDSFCFGWLEGGKQAIISTILEILINKLWLNKPKPLICRVFLLSCFFWFHLKRPKQTLSSGSGWKFGYKTCLKNS